MLAVATRVARRQGLAPPVPVTLEFPDAPGSKETSWQERVIDWLSLTDWRRIELGDDLDYVGPLAQRVLLRHGLLWPYTAHFYVPMLEAAGGGTLFTGGGGDGLFDTWRWETVVLMLSGRARPRLRQLPRLGYFASPLPLRRAAVRRTVAPLPWLTPYGQTLQRRAVAHNADEPRRFDKRTSWLASRRGVTVARRSADLVAADFGMRIEHPLMDAPVQAAVAREGGRFGPGDRTTAMRRFFDLRAAG